MDISPESVLLQNLNIQNLIEYINLTGWQSVTPPSDYWQVFHGAEDINGDPLEIVFPQNLHVRDINIYVASAINLLSALSNTSPPEMVKRIKFYDTDILDIRNPSTGEYDSIPLSMASNQITHIKNLVAYAACSEYDPRPSFAQKNLTIAKKMTRHYRFGHTKPGSFIFTIESKIVNEPTRYEYKQKPLPLFDEDDSLEDDPPVERKVMERIIRGLLSAKQATSERDINILVDAYGYGFNAEMCQSITRIAPKNSMPLEYNVLWSPKIAPSSDIQNPGRIELNETNYTYLKQASETLKNVEPAQITIRGMVKAVASEGNPLGTDTQRSVIIKWTNRPNGRAVNILVTLNKNDYIQAHQAHIDWNTVELTGYLQENPSLRRLADPQNFKIVA